MARDVSSALSTAVQGETISPIGMVELRFDSGTVRLWTGIGDLTWPEGSPVTVWTGAGTLGRIGPVEETVEPRAVGVELELSGIPAAVLEIAVEQSWQGRVALVYYAALSGREFVGDPLLIFSGMMDAMTLVEGDSATIRIACESNQIDLERTRVRRWTAEDQRNEYAGDKGCDAVAALQELEIQWGRSA